VVTHASHSGPNGCVLLSTAVVLVTSKDSSQQLGRALLDSGSQASFITKDFLDRLGCETRAINISVTGVGGATTRSTEAAQIKLHSRLNSFSTVLDCMVTERIADDIPTFTMKRSAVNVPRNIQLANPNFNISSKVDLLIGAEVFWSLVCVGQIKASDKHPTLQKTRLGWILARNLNYLPSYPQRVNSLCASVSNAELDDRLSKFWQMDNIQTSSKVYTLEESICERHFTNTVARNPQGRYIVQLPLKQDLINNLGNSRDTALRRLHGLEKHLSRHPELNDSIPISCANI